MGGERDEQRRDEVIAVFVPIVSAIHVQIAIHKPESTPDIQCVQIPRSPKVCWHSMPAYCKSPDRIPHSHSSIQAVRPSDRSRCGAGVQVRSGEGGVAPTEFSSRWMTISTISRGGVMTNKPLLLHRGPKSADMPAGSNLVAIPTLGPINKGSISFISGHEQNPPTLW